MEFERKVKLSELKVGDLFRPQYDRMIRVVYKINTNNNFTCFRVDGNAREGNVLFDGDEAVLRQEFLYKFKVGDIVWQREYGRGKITDIKPYGYYHFLPELTYVSVRRNGGVHSQNVGLMEVPECDLSAGQVDAKYWPLSAEEQLT